MNLRHEANRTDLVKQLLYFDEEFSEELSRTSVGTAEKHKLMALSERYCGEINRLLGQGDQGEATSGKVLIGSRATIRYTDDGSEETYTLVLPNSSNIDDGHISFLSPLGMNLLMRELNEEVSVMSPAGAYTVKVVEIA